MLCYGEQSTTSVENKWNARFVNPRKGEIQIKAQQINKHSGKFDLSQNRFLTVPMK